jgi:hypothetical protein
VRERVVASAQAFLRAARERERERMDGVLER